MPDDAGRCGRRCWSSGSTASATSCWPARPSGRSPRRRRSTLLGGPRGRAGGRLLPGVDDVAGAGARPGSIRPPARSTRRRRRWSRGCARRPSTRALVLTSFHQSPLPHGAAAAAGRRAVDRRGQRRLPGLPARRPAPRAAPTCPRPSARSSLAAAAGFAPAAGDDGRLRVRGRPAASSATPAYVVVHPGASVPARAWSAERCAAGGRGARRRGSPVVVTGGPGERALTARGRRAHRGTGPRRPDRRSRSWPRVLAGPPASWSSATPARPTSPPPSVPRSVSLFAPVVPADRWAPYAGAARSSSATRRRRARAAGRGSARCRAIPAWTGCHRHDVSPPYGQLLEEGAA